MKTVNNVIFLCLTFAAPINALRFNSLAVSNEKKCKDLASFAKRRRSEDCKTIPDFTLSETVDTAIREKIAHANMLETWHHSFYQSEFRLQQAMKKWMSMSTSDEFTIVLIGGSISTGKGCPLKTNWVEKLRSHLTSSNISKVKLLNWAVGASNAGSMIARWNQNKQQLSEADLIIVEYNVNEQYGSELDDLNADERMSKADRENEELMHLMLSLPNKPAVLYFDLPGAPPKRENKFPAIEESLHINVSKSFGVPIVWYADIERQVGDQLWWSAKQNTSKHPFCNTHEIMAKQMYDVLQETMKSVCEHGVQGEDPPLPKITNEFERNCADLSTFSAFASSKNGRKGFPIKSAGEWIFKEDVKGKPGWIAPIGTQSEIVFSDIPIELGGVKIEYMRTYENIGSVECKIEMNNVIVKSMKLEGLWQDCASLLYAAQFSDIPRGTYNLRCLSDGAKFKITGLMSC